MKALLITLLVIWLVVALLGALIEGLLWLTAIGVLLLVATAAWGWFRARNAASGRGSAQT